MEKEEKDMTVLIEKLKNTLNESKIHEMEQSLQNLRILGEEIITKYPDAFSEESLEKIIKEARIFSKEL